VRKRQCNWTSDILSSTIFYKNDSQSKFPCCRLLLSKRPIEGCLNIHCLGTNFHAEWRNEFHVCLTDRSLMLHALFNTSLIQSTRGSLLRQGTQNFNCLSLFTKRTKGARNCLDIMNVQVPHDLQNQGCNLLKKIAMNNIRHFEKLLECFGWGA